MNESTEQLHSGACQLSLNLFRGKRTLFDYQRQDVERILQHRPRPFVLHLEMGLGKTTEAWALINAERIYCMHHQIPWRPALIVAPKSVLGNWEREGNEYALWSDQEYIHVYQGAARAKRTIRNNCVAILTTYDTVRVDSSAGDENEFLADVPRFSVLIIDEAHIVRNVRLCESAAGTPDPAKTAAAVVALSARATLRYALTGTPYVNRDRDLVALAKLIGSDNWHWLLAVPPADSEQSNQLGVGDRHVRRRNSNAVDERALLRWMSESMVSRRKQDVFGDRLPQKTVQVEWLELTGDEKDAYELCVRDIDLLVRSRSEPSSSAAVQNCSGRLLALVTRLRQICLSEAVFLHADSIRHAYRNSLETRDAYSVDVEHYFQNSTKARRVFIDICCILQTERRIVVASESKVFIQMIAVLLKQNRPEFDIFVLTGDVAKVSDREAMLAQFRDAARPTVLLMTRQCGGIGINLSCAQTLLVCDSWWNSAAFEQLVDRLHRYGQQLPVLVKRYTMRQTIEEFLLMHEARKHLESTRLMGSADVEEQLAQMRYDALQQRGAASILSDIVAYLRKETL